MLVLIAGCEVGEGEGELAGTVVAEACDLNGEYDLNPTYFAAESYEKRLEIVVQRGSDLSINSDGLFVTVINASEVREHYLGTPLKVAYGFREPIQAVMYFNDSCEIDRRTNPVALNAVSGTIVFDKIYAPGVNEDDENIAATLSDIKLANISEPESGYGTVNGYFKFTFSRGRPAQRFP